MSSLKQNCACLGLYTEHMGKVQHIRRLNGLSLGTPEAPSSNLTEEQKANVKKCVAAYIKVADEVVLLAPRIIKYTVLFGLLTGSGVGYGVGKLVKTNNNPSGLKTALTVLGSNFVNTPIAVGLGATVAANSITTVGEIAELKDLETECDKLSVHVKNEITRIKNLPTDERNAALTELGLSEAEIKKVNGLLEQVVSELASAVKLALVVVLTRSSALAYHGYKRSGGLSALGFFLFGGAGGLGVALSQGFAKPISSVEQITKK